MTHSPCPPGYEPLERAILIALGADPDRPIPAHLRMEGMVLRSAFARVAPSESWRQCVTHQQIQQGHETLCCVLLEEFLIWASETLRRREQRAKAAFKFRVDENPAAAIAEFLSHFGQVAPGVYKQYRTPPQWLMEYIANCFRQWQTHGGSLDEAFRVRASGRGQSTPRERLNQPYEDFEIHFLYQAFLEKEQEKHGGLHGAEAAWERATQRVADELGLSVGTVRRRLRRI